MDILKKQNIEKALRDGKSYNEISVLYSTSKSTISKIKGELGLSNRRVEGEGVRAVEGSKIREHIKTNDYPKVKDEKIKEIAQIFLKIERKRLIKKEEREILLVELLKDRVKTTNQTLEFLKQILK